MLRKQPHQAERLSHHRSGIVVVPRVHEGEVRPSYILHELDAQRDGLDW